MKRDYKFFIEDIVDSIRQIECFVGDMTYEEFLADDKTVSAILRRLDVIGEASKHIPTSFKQKHQDLPWAEMARMRDKLIHGYFGVDYEIVWKVVKERLPEIKPPLEIILNPMKR